MSIADWPNTDRPQKKLLSKDPASLSDMELLATFLRSGVHGKNAVEIGQGAAGSFMKYLPVFILGNHHHLIGV